MADKIATRESYGNALVACAEDFPNMVVLDADLAGANFVCRRKPVRWI